MATVTSDGQKRSILTSAATTQVKSGAGVLGRLFVTEVGTTMTVDIYDATSGTDAATKVVTYVTADGKVDWQLGIPMTTGIRVVIGGTPGRVILCWE